ncbi:MAG: hypothetical protein AAFR98_12845 [Pseudomonadota bacterium]
MGIFSQVLGRLSGVPPSSHTPSSHTQSTAPPRPTANAATAAPPVPQPVKVRSRVKRADTSRYLSDLRAPLIKLSKRDTWTLEDAVAGTHIFGGNGSGKTTGSGQTIAKAYLRAGFGGLVMCAKPDERDNWVRYAKACGRDKHLIIISADGPWRFNFIQYELERPGDPATRVENLLSTLMNILEQTGRERGGGEDGGFWQQAAELLLRNALMVLAASQAHFSLFELQRFIDTAPQDAAQAASRDWQSSMCAKALDAARASFDAAGRTHDFEVLNNYWTVQYPSLADRTRSSVVFTLTTLLQDLQVGTLRELFATGSNVFPEDTHEGAIILLDLPAVLNRSHAVAQTLFKVVWQQSVLRRMPDVNRHTRPVFLWADEAHFFVSPYDTSFQSLARAARACTVYMTQNVSAYHHRLPAKNAEAVTSALLGYFQTQIFHAQADPKTIQHAQAIVGRTQVTRHNQSGSTTYGTNYGENEGSSSGTSSSSSGDGKFSVGGQGSLNQGQSWGMSRSQTTGYATSTAVEDMLNAHHFTQLKTGTDVERGISEAILFRTGRTWATGRPYLQTKFTRHLK